MTIRHIVTKIGHFIENRQIFMLLNCNCANLANFEDFQTCLGAVFRGHSVLLSYLPNDKFYQPRSGHWTSENTTRPTTLLCQRWHGASSASPPAQWQTWGRQRCRLLVLLCSVCSWHCSWRFLYLEFKAFSYWCNMKYTTTCGSLFNIYKYLANEKATETRGE